ncbi:MAG TPA: DUF4394 domain-containing protein, partial [Planctomycetota bacterium]|nr:DUF4394 domain-containing protein [Planctomycetota bacterium]
LFAIGASKHVYVVDPANGAATLVGNPASAPALVGTHFTIDFEPTSDQIRVVTDQAFNLRLSPVTGLVAGLDARLFFDFADPHSADLPELAAIAYGPSAPGAVPTTLYGIDSVFDILVRVGGPNGVPSPNDGDVVTLGSLGIDATETLTGFDVDASGGAYATITPGASTTSKIVTVDLATGAVQEQGTVAGSTLRDVAVPVPSPPRAFAVTSANRLVEFPLSSANKPTSSKTISGLAAGESIVGIDVRPKSGELFAITNESRLYRLPTSGAAAAALVGAGPFTPALSGTKFGVDFDPVSGLLRVVSDTGQNLRIDADTGAVTATDTVLAFAAGDPNAAEVPNVVAIAYDRSFDGTPATTLFGIDAALASLVRVGGANGTPSPSGGQLATIGPLGASVAVSDAAFDVPAVGDAFAVVTAPGASTSTLYRIDLATGAATPIGPCGGGQKVVAFALAP